MNIQTSALLFILFFGTGTLRAENVVDLREHDVCSPTLPPIVVPPIIAAFDPFACSLALQVHDIQRQDAEKRKERGCPLSAAEYAAILSAFRDNREKCAVPPEM